MTCMYNIIMSGHKAFIVVTIIHDQDAQHPLHFVQHSRQLLKCITAMLLDTWKWLTPQLAVHCDHVMNLSMYNHEFAVRDSCIGSNGTGGVEVVQRFWQDKYTHMLTGRGQPAVTLLQWCSCSSTVVRGVGAAIKLGGLKSIWACIYRGHDQFCCRGSEGRLPRFQSLWDHFWGHVNTQALLYKPFTAHS